MSLGMRAPLTGLEIPRRYRLRGLFVFFLLHEGLTVRRQYTEYPGMR